MLKVVITEEKIEMKGNVLQLLTGLTCFVEELKSNNVPKKLIRETVELGLKDKEEIDKAIENILKKIFE